MTSNMADDGYRGVTQRSGGRGRDRHDSQAIPVVAVTPESRCTKTSKTRGDRQLRSITGHEGHPPRTLKRPAAESSDEEEIKQALLALRGLRVRLAGIQAKIMKAEGLSKDSNSRTTTAYEADGQEAVSLQRRKRHSQSPPAAAKVSRHTQRQQQSLIPIRRGAEDYQTQDKAQRGLGRVIRYAPPPPGPRAEDSIAGTSHGVPDGVALRDEAPQHCLQEMKRKTETDVYMYKSPLPTFTGRSREEYLTFSELFHQYVSAMSVPDSYKLQLLLQACTSERVKVVLDGCLDLGPIAGYEKALAILRERFRDKYLCAEEMVTDLLRGSPVGANDVTGLEDLADNIWLCVDGLRLLDMTHEVDMNQHVPGLASRLTGKAWEQYEDEACEYWERHGTPPGIEWLEEFVRKVAAKARRRTDLDWQGEYDVRRQLPQRETKPARRHTQRRATSRHGQYTGTGCPLCQDPHVLPQCPAFRRMAVMKRRKTVRRLRCCFSCLAASHMSAECWGDNTCGVKGCRERHSKWLHRKKSSRRGHTRTYANLRTEHDDYGYQDYGYDDWHDYEYSGRETSPRERRSRVHREVSPY